MSIMKVIHFDSGFGNQISIYAEYLAMKYANPDDDIFMEDIVYSIPETEEYLAMWQGYELEKVFGITIPNISQLFSEAEYKEIIDEVRKTNFWRNDWDYPPVIVDVLARHGLQLKNTCKSNFIFNESCVKSGLRSFLKVIRRNRLGGFLISKTMRIFERLIVHKESYYKVLYNTTDENLYFGQTGYPLYKSARLELIEEQLRKDLSFKPVLSEKNAEILSLIESSNSVAIHARRGDLLKYIDYCYSNGYFIRAARYIKKKVEHPVFFVFSDAESSDWIKENKKTLGLSSEDTCYVIDWNKDNDSYIDMYLMSRCKHDIFTKSSFGFWAAWLNENPEKITCSSDVRINSTNHF